ANSRRTDPTPRSLVPLIAAAVLFYCKAKRAPAPAPPSSANPAACTVPAEPPSRSGAALVVPSPAMTIARLDAARSAQSSAAIWERDTLPALTEYSRTPNRSPSFDADWRAAGHMERAVALIEAWCRSQPIAGLSVEVVRLPDRTPLIFMEVPATAPGLAG